MRRDPSGRRRPTIVDRSCPERRILVVEDDDAIARMLEIELADAGYEVQRVARGDEALTEIGRDCSERRRARSAAPRRRRPAVCRQARREGYDGPILMLTALDRLGDRCSVSTPGRTTTWPSRSPSRSCWPACVPCSARATSRARRVSSAGPVLLDRETPQVHRRRAPGRAHRAWSSTCSPTSCGRTGSHLHARADLRGRVGLRLPGREQGHRRVRVVAAPQARTRRPEQSIVRTVRGVGYTVRRVSIRTRLTLSFVAAMAALVLCDLVHNIPHRPLAARVAGRERGSARWPAPRPQPRPTRRRSTGSEARTSGSG